MKYLLPLLMIVLLSSCSNKNKLMTKLLNQRSPLEDSVKMAGLKSEEFMLKAEKSARAGEDTSVWHQYTYISSGFEAKQIEFTKQLKAVNFSIDSLSKMK